MNPQRTITRDGRKVCESCGDKHYWDHVYYTDGDKSWCPQCFFWDFRDYAKKLGMGHNYLPDLSDEIKISEEEISKKKNLVRSKNLLLDGAAIMLRDTVTLEEVESEIEIARFRSKKEDHHNYHKDHCKNHSQYAISRLERLKEVISICNGSNGKYWWGPKEEYLRSLILINGDYVFSLATCKWRKDWSFRWYNSKGVKDFFERFVD